MFRYTDTKFSPWWVVNADDKRRARLNCITHLLSQVPYKDITSAPVTLPDRGPDTTCGRRSTSKPSSPKSSEMSLETDYLVVGAGASGWRSSTR